MLGGRGKKEKRGEKKSRTERQLKCRCFFPLVTNCSLVLGENGEGEEVKKLYRERQKQVNNKE